ncbi:MAG: ATP-binding cassette domain-containing protein, partial [Spirochaetia bacterium]
MLIEAVNGEALISVEKLSFTYPSAAQQTLSALDFEVRRGGVYGFLGPSGAGKSTTQKILYGLLGGYSGAVRIAGKEIREWGATF